MADAGRRCAECRAVVYLDVVTADEVWALCRRAMCPYWRRGHPSDPGQVDKDRWFEQKRRAEADALNEPVPD